MTTFSEAAAALEPDRSHIETFIDAVFRRASHGYVSVRAFTDDQSSKVFRISSAPISSRDFLADVVEDDARRAAQAPDKIVFCPPACTFHSKDKAAESDVAEGLVITVELDDHPQEARDTLEPISKFPTTVDPL